MKPMTRTNTCARVCVFCFQNERMFRLQHDDVKEMITTMGFYFRPIFEGTSTRRSEKHMFSSFGPQRLLLLFSRVGGINAHTAWGTPFHNQKTGHPIRACFSLCFFVRGDDKKKKHATILQSHLFLPCPPTTTRHKQR